MPQAFAWSFNSSSIGETGKTRGRLLVARKNPVTEEEMEIARLKRENAELRMERDILKNATAYFAKESLRGTRS